MPVVFSTHTLHPRAENLIAAVADLRIASAADTDTLLREGRDADIVIVRAPLPEALFHDPPRLRAAIRHGAGLDMIPVEVATRAGVLVANVPGANARGVAEHVFFTVIAILRRFRMVDADLRAKGWQAGRAHSDHGHELSGRKLGIVGFGAVGREVFRIGHHGFALSVAAHTRNPDNLPPEVEALPLDDLVAASDVLVLCCPLTPETTGLLSAARIARMKPFAVLVNVARGPVVDDAALLAALGENRILGAALDVFATQPLPPGHPYLALPNVLITPHMAGITEESMERIGVVAAEETLRVLRGELPVNLRNPEVVEAYRRRFI